MVTEVKNTKEEEKLLKIIKEKNKDSRLICIFSENDEENTSCILYNHTNGTLLATIIGELAQIITEGLVMDGTLTNNTLEENIEFRDNIAKAGFDAIRKEIDKYIA